MKIRLSIPYRQALALVAASVANPDAVMDYVYAEVRARNPQLGEDGWDVEAATTQEGIEVMVRRHV